MGSGSKGKEYCVIVRVRLGRTNAVLNRVHSRLSSSQVNDKLANQIDKIFTFLRDSKHIRRTIVLEIRSSYTGREREFLR